jgi:DNA-binding CsgD family transcriptional regulator
MPTLPTPNLIGRDAELAQLGRFLDAPERLPRALVLQGDPGIGKTVLWHAAIDLARARGYRVLTHRASRAETRVMFGGLASLFDGIAGDDLSALPSPQARALEAALLLDDVVESVDRRAIVAAALGLVLRLAGRGPVVIAIDDLCFLDARSAMVLGAVAHRLDREPVGMIATARLDADRRIADQLEHGFEHGRFTRLGVGPLSLRELSLVMEGQLGTSPAPRLVRRIHDEARGNTLRALEVAAALPNDGVRQPVAEPLVIAAEARTAVVARLRRLPEASFPALLAVAALPEPTAAHLRRALGSAVASRLQPALDAGILERDDDDYRFSHPLLRSAVYAKATPEERRAAHTKLARYASDPETRARHRALSIEGPDAEVARSLDDAAKGAAERGTAAEAADLLELAIEVTPPDDERRTRQRRSRAGTHRIEAGDVDGARILLESVVTSHADDELGIRARYQLAMLLADAGETAAAIEASLDLLDSMPADHALVDAVRSLLAELLVAAGDVVGAARHARAGAAATRSVGDRAASDRADPMVRWTDFVLGRGDTPPVAVAPPAADVAARGPSEIAGEIRPELLDATMLKWSDRFEEARALFERARGGAAGILGGAIAARTWSEQSEMERWAGDLDAARRCAREGKEAAFGSGARAEAPFLTHDAWLGALEGRIDEARGTATDLVDEALATGNVAAAIRNLTLLGFIELSIGEPAASHPWLDRAVRLATEGGRGDPGIFRFHADAVESFVATDELDRAERMVACLERLGRATDRPWTRVAAARGRASVAIARGRDSQAIADLEEALEHHERLEMPLEQGRTLLTLGVARRRARRRRQARDALTSALAIFERMGATLWTERTRGELERFGHRCTSPTDLTPAERRVAELVARGLSNKGIAAELVLSVHTIESQLSSVYAKLGIHSRTELTHHVLTLPETEPPRSSRLADLRDARTARVS